MPHLDFELWFEKTSKNWSIEQWQKLGSSEIETLLQEAWSTAREAQASEIENLKTQIEQLEEAIEGDMNAESLDQLLQEAEYFSYAAFEENKY